MFARLAVQLLVWGVTLAVARLLTPFDYGLMTTGMIFIGLADLLGEAGVGRALIQKKELEPADLGHAFTISLALSAGLYAALWAAAGPVGAYLDQPEFPPFLRVLGLFVLLVPFRTVPLALLDRDLRMGRQAAAHVLSSLLQSGTVLALALAGWGYWSLAVGTVVGRLLEVAALMRATGWAPGLLLPGAGQLGLVRFGAHVMLGNLLWFLYSNSDFAVVGKFAGVVELGYYSLAYQLMSLPVLKLTSSINQIVYPVFCRLQDDRERLRDWYVRLTVLLSFLGAPTLAGMALVAPDAFSVLLGPKWGPAILPFRLLATVGVLLVVVASLPPLLNALGRPELPFRYTAVCAVIMPASFVVGVRVWGVVGVCLAWLVVYPVIVAGFYHFTRRVTGVGLGHLLRAHAPVLGAVLVMVACVLLAQHAARGLEPAGLRLALTVATGALVYAGVLMLFARRTVLADLLTLWAELRGRKR
jgi:O-antigen/teichoic acid export membrane protein